MCALQGGTLSANVRSNQRSLPEKPATATSLNVRDVRSILPRLNSDHKVASKSHAPLICLFVQRQLEEVRTPTTGLLLLHM